MIQVEQQKQQQQKEEEQQEKQYSRNTLRSLKSTVIRQKLAFQGKPVSRGSRGRFFTDQESEGLEEGHEDPSSTDAQCARGSASREMLRSNYPVTTSCYILPLQDEEIRFHPPPSFLRAPVSRRSLPELKIYPRKQSSRRLNARELSSDRVLIG